jgi:hypothetical protein
MSRAQLVEVATIDPRFLFIGEKSEVEQAIWD